MARAKDRGGVRQSLRGFVRQENRSMWSVHCGGHGRGGPRVMPGYVSRGGGATCHPGRRPLEEMASVNSVHSSHSPLRHFERGLCVLPKGLHRESRGVDGRSSLEMLGLDLDTELTLSLKNAAPCKIVAKTLLSRQRRYWKMFVQTRSLGVGLVLMAASGDPKGCCSLQSEDLVASDTSHSGARTSSSASLESPSSFSDSEHTGASSDVSPACQPGQERQCSIDASGIAVVFPVLPIPPTSPCRLGWQRCGADFRWGGCKGTIGPALQDRCDLPGNDADCDGVANSGCACLEHRDENRPCGSTQGACRQGVQSCKNGTWGQCVGGVRPNWERCDGKGVDEDCDGKIDRQDPDCQCLDGDNPRTCTIPSRKVDCGLGQQACVNGEWGGCMPRFTARPEACGVQNNDDLGDALGDEDCDGQIDEAGDTLYAQGCQYYILDKDGDGYGALGSSSLEDSVAPTWGCFCSPPPNEWGLVKTTDRKYTNADCGDCEDLTGNSVPAGDPYLTYPSKCLLSIQWHGGAFDLNCNGLQERMFRGIGGAYCVASEDGDCELVRSSPGFWYSPPGQPQEVPDCGESGMALPRCVTTKDESGKTICNLEWAKGVRQRCR